MTIKVLRDGQRLFRRFTRKLFAALPTALRFGLYRRAIDFSPAAQGTLELKIADTQAELEQCFALLHDAYVASGFMRPHASGLRVTPYHALPTTTTLCAKVDGRVVGTLSIVREGVFGFPMQTAFDISSVRSKDGRIAEISALAVHPSYRKTGGSVLFPLMKFMYEYCTKYFDTRHLLIAVNPNHIEMYESLLFFKRLTAEGVDRYDFANGAPAVGATLDLLEAPQLFERAYSGKPGRRNLHRFFVETHLPEIRYPARPWHVSNDPVLTPALLRHFFKDRTEVFSQLDSRQRQLLHSLYPGAEWVSVLPELVSPLADDEAIRQYPRYSLRCPASFVGGSAATSEFAGAIIEASAGGFKARVDRPLAPGDRVTAKVELAQGVNSNVVACVVRQISGEAKNVYGFAIDQSDFTWQRCASWLDNAGNAPTQKVEATLTTTPDSRALVPA